MDARILRAVLATAVLLVSLGAQHRSDNFIIETNDPRFAQVCAETAEKCRRDLAVEWLGQELPKWWRPCPMTIRVGPNLGAGGATSFVFDRGEVYNWVMSIQGSPERLLDSVIPHEVTHMIFASHFRRPLPRWADEGGATSVEHATERNKHRAMLDQFLRTDRGIPFSRMFAMTEYPRDVMPLYAQGYSLAEYLIQTGGRRKYIDFLDDALKSGDWPGAVQRNYGPKDLNQLQNNWLAWVKQGSPIYRQPGSPAGNSPILLVVNPPRSPVGPSSGPSAPPIPPDVTLAGPLVSVPNLQPRSVPASNPYAFAQVSLPGSSVYAPHSSPLLSEEGSLRNSAGPLGEGQGVRAKNQVAVTPAVLTADGWRARGNPALMATSSPAAVSPAPSAPVPSATQVTRPQPVEGPKQIILEWNAR
jgi:hypothetical protein